MKSLKLSLILPVHNEETIIEPVLKDVLSVLNGLKAPYEVILVENGSSDGSYKVVSDLAEKCKNVFAIKTSQGWGSAILAGIKKSRGEYISYMQSDGQIDMQVFPKLWKLAQENRYEMVKARRKTRDTFIRKITTRSFSRILRFFFNTPLVDVNGSPRIMLHTNLNLLRLSSRDSFIDAELLIKANKLKWRIYEIPMRNLSRAGGKSNVSFRTYLEFFRNIIRYRFRS